MKKSEWSEQHMEERCERSEHSEHRYTRQTVTQQTGECGSYFFSIAYFICAWYARGGRAESIPVRVGGMISLRPAGFCYTPLHNFMHFMRILGLSEKIIIYIFSTLRQLCDCVENLFTYKVET